MHKIAIAAASLLMLQACNNDDSSRHSEQASSDSATHMNHHEQNTGNEMTAIMSGMMTRMHQQKPTGNNDIDYANMMLQHHQAAVDMANLQISKGKDDSLKTFSRKVIAAQEKEIAFMGEFISRTQATASANNDVFKTAIDASMQSMMSNDIKVYNDIDKDFVAQMIPHHQAAVDMAKEYLQYGSDAGLKKMSNDIIASQSSEIAWLKEMRNKNE